LKCSDPAGFEVGEKIDCPKCETRFAVRAPARPREEETEPPRKKAVKASAAEDDEDDRPRKKKRRRDDDEDDDDRPRKKKKRDRDEDERSGYQKYKSSPIRFIVLGVLVLIMLVLGFFLYLKWQKEKENASRPFAPLSQFLS
jgi:hypothetical protein